MKIHSISCTKPNGYTSNKTVRGIDNNNINNNIYKQMTDLSTMPNYYTYLPNNINFNGHNLKTLDRREFRELKNSVKKFAKQNGIYLGDDSYAFKSAWNLQLTDYLLHHKVFENDSFKRDGAFNVDINLWVHVTSDRNRHMPSYQHVTDIDEDLLKANCEAIMDFADFIAEHPIYSNPEVKRLLPPILGHIEEDNIDTRKITANYLATHPDKMEDEFHVYDDLVTGEGYEWHIKYEDDFDEDYYLTLDVNQLGQPKLPEQAAQATEPQQPVQQPQQVQTQAEPEKFPFDVELLGHKLTNNDSYIRNDGFNDITKYIDSDNFNPNMTDELGRNVIQIALTSRDEGVKAIISKALSKGVDINAQNKFGQTVLMTAIKNFITAKDDEEKMVDLSVIKFILDQNPNMDIQDKNKQTAFHFACMSKTPALLTLIFTKNPNILFEDVKGKRAANYLKTDEMKETYRKHINLD